MSGCLRVYRWYLKCNAYLSKCLCLAPKIAEANFINWAVRLELYTIDFGTIGAIYIHIYISKDKYVMTWKWSPCANISKRNRRLISLEKVTTCTRWPFSIHNVFVFWYVNMYMEVLYMIYMHWHSYWNILFQKLKLKHFCRIKTSSLLYTSVFAFQLYYCILFKVHRIHIFLKHECY